jgi:hypothetical protein
VSLAEDFYTPQNLESRGSRYRVPMLYVECLNRTVISVPCFSFIGRFHCITVYNSFRSKFAMIKWPCLVETVWSVCIVVKCPNCTAWIVDTQPESTADWLLLVFISLCRPQNIWWTNLLAIPLSFSIRNLTLCSVLSIKNHDFWERLQRISGDGESSYKSDFKLIVGNYRKKKICLLNLPNQLVKLIFLHRTRTFF